jgi:LEA14-like dessication related protein
MLPRAPLLFAISLLVSACSLFVPRFEKPTVTVAGIQFTGGNLLEQHFRVTLTVQNPNDRALPVKHLLAQLRSGGEEVASGESTQAFIVPAMGTANLDLTITANIALALLLTAKHKQDHSAVDYEVSGVVDVDLPFLRTIAFHQTGNFGLGGGS